MVTITPHPTRRGGFQLQTELRLAQPLDEVFAFFADAWNLEQITPPWLKFQVLTPRPIELQAGTLLDYRLRLHGWPIRWQTEIGEWNPPYSFVDRQLIGPYRYWIHRHTFSTVGDVTLVQDQVEYAVPGGALVHRLLVRRDVQRIFEYRQAAMQKVFAGSVSSPA